MNRTWDVEAWLVAAILLLALAPFASGQDVTATAASSAGQPSVERMKNGFAVVPDFRFTELDGKFASLAGAQAGWMTDRTLFIGAGGYWLTDSADDREMAYGGAVVEWALRGERRFGFSARALIGAGSATLSRQDDGTGAANLSPRFPGSFYDRGRFWHSRALLVKDDFFVAEPQLTLLWNMKDWLRLGAGVGYRLIGSADPLEDRLRGTSGSLSLQIGGS